jgi:hypothetical protein
MADPQNLAIDAYLKELIDLATKRLEIERRTARVEKAVRAMIDLLEGEPEYESYLERFDDVVRPAGLTAAISALLQVAGDAGLTPMEVRDAATKSNVLQGHSNPLASVHTVLKRLSKTDNFEKITKDGQPAYRFVSAGERMLRDLQLHAAAGSATSAATTQGTPQPTVRRRRSFRRPLETHMQLYVPPVKGR